jgi:transposase
MAKYKPYNYGQSLLMPICLKDQLIPGTIEFAIHHLVDTRLDLSLLDSRFNNDETGRPAYDPRVLLKIVLVAYTHGIVHSRKIEQACRENSVCMALTCGQVPDHTTIASFVSSMKESCYMKTSHGMIQGYNAHSLVTGTQVIVDAQAFGEGQDYAHVAPMVAGAKENLQAIG